jgi:hypothetical protein
MTAGGEQSRGNLRHASIAEYFHCEIGFGCANRLCVAPVNDGGESNLQVRQCCRCVNAGGVSVLREMRFADFVQYFR